MQCRAKNIPVFALPGPSSVLAALTVAGMVPYPFHFFGFLPSKAVKRQEILRSVNTYFGTLIFFESPKRLQETLQEALKVFGPRLAVVARELTKKFEEVRRETLDQLVTHYNKTPPKGEIVLLIAGVCEVGPTEKEDLQAILGRHLVRCSVKDAVRLTHKETGWPRTQLYRMALAIQKGSCT
jgi:16S rRNA (cytidine1402-2'-O)-methyltransferase